MKKVLGRYKTISYSDCWYGVDNIRFALAIYAMIAIPYKEAVIRWRGNEEDVYRNPEKVPPVWVNLFRQKICRKAFTSY